MEAQATRTTNGIEIVATVIRSVIDRQFDGYKAGREAFEIVKVTMIKDGKVLCGGQGVTPLWERNSADMDAKRRGAVGKLGTTYVGANAAALINEAIAEADAAAPGDDEYQRIKGEDDRRKAAAEAANAADADAIWEAEQFERRMAAADSDL
jgi:hypothetical protein